MLALPWFAACQPSPEFATTTVGGETGAVTIQAVAATTPTLRDGANDPAIWINPRDPAASLIIGTDTQGGLEFYDLAGNRVAAISDRPMGLVDIRQGFDLGDGDTSLVVAYDVAAAEVLAYTIDAETFALRSVLPNAIRPGVELEGLCLFRSPMSGKVYVFGIGDGVVQQWELVVANGAASGRLTRKVPVGHGAGHCVVHDRSAAVYFSQEPVGVFKINAEPESETEKQVIDVVQPLGRYVSDIKGIAIHESGVGGHLLVSDADESRLQVYDLESSEHVGTVIVEGVDETEGIAATAMTLSAEMPGGLVVLTDDDNDGAHTNYKIVPWQAFANALGLAVEPAVAAPAQTKYVTVKPAMETDPVASFGDAADDPAIWVHPTNPELSTIIGAQKQRGVNVYDLDGRLLQSREDGRINNVDLRYGFSLAGKEVAIVSGSNRTTDGISIWMVDEDSRMLVDVVDGIIDTGMIDPYGLCMYHSSKSGEYFVFVNGTDGLVRQWRLEDNGSGRVRGIRVREFQLESQTEGCVADDETGFLYVGEEDVGIWKFSAEPDGGDERTFVDGVGDNGNLTADVEGLAIFYEPDGRGYLVASNQGADSFALYERQGDNRFIGIFHVVADEATGIDGISETDGLDVSSASFGSKYPGGIFVAQDGRNITPSENQNFKLVPWQRISDAMGLSSTAAD